MALLTGIGQALGAGSLGYLKGENLGEAAGYKRSQDALDREYKNAYLSTKTKAPKDPNEELRKNAGRTRLLLTRIRADPNMQAYFLSPQGIAHAKKLEQGIQHTWGVENGTIPPDEADSYLLSLAPDPAPTEGGAMDAAGAAKAAVPSLRPPGTSLATPEGTPLPPGGPESPSAAVAAAPPPTAPTGPAAPPAAPPTALEVYNELRNNPPQFTPSPGMTPQQALKEQARLDQQWRSQVDEARKAVTLEAESSRATSEATISGERAGQIGQELKGKRKLVGMQTVAAQEGALTSRATRPVKVAQGKAATEKAKVETKAIPERVKLQGRQVGAAEKQARIAQGRLDLDKEYKGDLMRRAQLSISEKASSKEDGYLRDRINTNYKILTAKQRTASGSDAFQFPKEKRNAAEAQLRKDMARRDELSKSSSASTTTTFKGRPDQAAALGKGGQKMFMGQKYTWPKFLAAGKKKGKREADLSAAWAGL